MNKIWRVSYGVRFSSSSGMMPYDNTRVVKDAYVVAGDSLSSVERTICKGLSSQETLLPITAGECLGDVLVKL